MRMINLALQGGGSHGAFTWGVLDALLENGDIGIDGISGTSAGAVNAVALAHGYAKALRKNGDARAMARESMARVWGEITTLGSLGAIQQNMVNMFWGGLSKELAPTNMMANAFGSMVSPYQSNPLDINPMRSLLEREIDFEAIASLHSPRVFVSATHVNTGKAEIFSGKKLTVQAVMASACLPMVFQAVEIDGEHYWDGGYSGNPAMTPLINHCASHDLVLVQINPIRREQIPHSPNDILDRVSELTFNASLLSQMRSIDFINRLLADGRLKESPYKSVLLHRIDGGEVLRELPTASKMSTDAALIRKLFNLGVECARRWMKRHGEALGTRSTVDIRRDYLDDMRLGGIST